MILASPEYFSSQGGSRNESFLTALYGDVLGRDPDPTGRAFFLQALSAGLSRSQIVVFLLSGVEAHQNLIQTWYQRFLRRAATPNEMAAQLLFFLPGIREEQLIALLLASPEYYSRP
jgi:hypothetical protein